MIHPMSKRHLKQTGLREASCCSIILNYFVLNRDEPPKINFRRDKSLNMEHLNEKTSFLQIFLIKFAYMQKKL